MIQDLPWLLPPAAEDRALLKAIEARHGLDDVMRLRQLAQLAWDDAGLRSIGRKLTRALQSAGDWRQAAPGRGLVSFNLLIVSSATFSQFVDALRATALRAGVVLECRLVEYEEPETWLALHGEELAAAAPDATLLALDGRTLQLQSPVGDAALAAECIQASLDRYQRIAQAFARCTGRTVIAQTLAPQGQDAQLSMDAWLPGSARYLRVEFNRRLATLAQQTSSPLFDAAALAELLGAATWDAGRFWYVAKLPFAPVCAPLYCERLVRLIAAMLGKSRRVLVLDLDNTLWGGVIGDDGVEGIELGSGTPRGEAHHAVQRMALQYKERGVILCVASKNTEEIALDAFARHPEMLLSREDIAMFQVNWDDKASNLKALSDTLELGLESFVFVDDNPVERKQVRDVLPQVAVPELPEDPSAWLPVFQAAAYFEQLGFSAEDRARTAYYRGNARRSVQARTIGDPAKFLESLQMTMTVAPFDGVGRTRIAQLIAKSNQFNLTTRRYSEAEVAAMQSAPDLETLQIRLRDLFGDNGMISVVICRKQASHWDIDAWIMSCRVLGRGVEQAVLNLLAARAKAAGAVELRGSYLPTAKNGLVKDHYLKLGFAQSAAEAGGATSWSLQLADFVPRPTAIALDERTAQS
jgi:FkbH-like protein